MMFLYNQTVHRTRFFYLFIAVIMLSAVLMTVSATYAHAQSDPFTVDNVEVDITSDNAVAAREQAFDAAQIKAYEMLAESLLDAEEFETFETPDLNRISNLVKDFEVTNESLSAVRYNATYTIRFREHNLGGYSPQKTASAKSDAVNKVSGDTLILPVIVKDGRKYLWSNSAYADSWKTAINGDMSERYILPLGDIQDRTALREDELLTYDYSRVQRMMQRYGAKKAAIVMTNPQAKNGSSPVADLSVYAVNRAGPALIKNMQVPIYPGETPEQLFPRLISQSKIVINNAPSMMRAETLPKATPAPNMMNSNTLTAEINFNSVRDWIEVKKSLERVPSIQDINVKSMSARAATIQIAYNGTPQSLSQEMMRSQMQLNTAYNNSYGQASLYKIQRIR